MATTLDVIAMAHRRLGVLSADDVPSADMDAFATDTLTALFDELATVHRVDVAWDLDTVPQAAFLPLSYLLAAEIAQHYERPAEPRLRALNRFLAYAFPDDRPDSRDLDEDGTVTDDEAEAGKRAVYF